MCVSAVILPFCALLSSNIFKENETFRVTLVCYQEKVTMLKSLLIWLQNRIFLWDNATFGGHMQIVHLFSQICS